MTNTFALSQNIVAKTYYLIQSFISDMLEYKTKKQMIRDTMRELNALTDRDLQDIGLSRYDIEMIAIEHAKLINNK